MFRNSTLVSIVLSLLFGLVACTTGQHDSQTATNNSTDTSASTANINSFETLEVIGVYGESDGDSVELISLDGNMKYTTIVSIPNLGNQYISLAKGDRVKIAGEYAESYPVQIFNITEIVRVANPDKRNCEANGNIWRPEGKAQIPTCVVQYSDGGKICTSSADCEGECKVTDENKPAQCASNNSHFGCGSSIEYFNKHGGILCVD